MSSSQNTNQSTNQTLPWTTTQGFSVSVTGPGTSELGVALADKVTFDAATNGIMFLRNGAITVPSWGTWAPTSDPDKLTGFTNSLQPFTIVRSVGNGFTVLTCTLDPSPAVARRIRSTLLGTLAGALVAAAVGALTRFSLAGPFLVGLVGAAASIHGHEQLRVR